MQFTLLPKSQENTGLLVILSAKADRSQAGIKTKITNRGIIFSTGGFVIFRAIFSGQSLIYESYLPKSAGALVQRSFQTSPLDTCLRRYDKRFVF